MYVLARKKRRGLERVENDWTWKWQVNIGERADVSPNDPIWKLVRAVEMMSVEGKVGSGSRAFSHENPILQKYRAGNEK